MPENWDLRTLLWAAFIAGGVLGGFVGALAEAVLAYWLDGRRQRQLKRDELVDLARNWDSNDRPNLFRHSQLRETDLRGVKLCRADLSYADLCCAELEDAALRRYS